MSNLSGKQASQAAAQARVEIFRHALGPFVVAAENTRMPMVFTDAEMTGHPVVFANDSFLRLSGYKRESLLGLGIARLLEEPNDPDALTSVEDSLNEQESGSQEAMCRHADGTPYLATVYLTPVPDEEGVVRQNFLSFVEVSGRIERLIKQHDQFSVLYEKTPGFIAILDGPQHRFTFANASYERLVGRRDLTGHSVKELFPEIADQGFLVLLDRVFQTGRPFVGNNMPIRFSTENGRSSALHYVNFVYQPVRDEDGTIMGLFVEGYDVTAERLAAEKLLLLQGEAAHASRINAMGMMAATLAHELNQPLTAISTYAGASARLVEAGLHDGATLREALNAIEEAAVHAGDIIRNVRELARRGEAPQVSFNLKVAITECLRLVRGGGCPAATIDDHTPEALTVFGNRTHVQQIIINLLRNACDATDAKESSLVTVVGEQKGNEVIVTVIDSGPGLSLESAENIFTWTSSSKEGGTGLGLSLCRTMIEAQNGSIWLEQSDEHGSQFCFSIPAGNAMADAEYAN